MEQLVVAIMNGFVWVEIITENNIVVEIDILLMKLRC